jgi:serine/threonine protein kinase
MIWAEGHNLKSGKYQIARQIGIGGFGLTYLAKDLEDLSEDRQVVIKTPNRGLRDDGDYEKFVKRFQHEAQMLGKINHPNVVRVLDFFEEEGIPCLVMEYVAGETLNAIVKRRGYLPENEALQYFRKLAEALHTVHQTELIHCDVHPRNIILRQESGTPQPVLIDFGSAKSLQPSTLTVSMTWNEYSPYEQEDEKRNNKGDKQRNNNRQPTLDVYGLAATLYLVVTGEKPEPATNRKLYGKRLKPPKHHRSELSDWLNRAILKGMALEAKNRPRSMQV